MKRSEFIKLAKEKLINPNKGIYISLSEEELDKVISIFQEVGMLPPTTYKPVIGAIDGKTGMAAMYDTSTNRKNVWDMEDNEWEEFYKLMNEHSRGKL